MPAVQLEQASNQACAFPLLSQADPVRSRHEKIEQIKFLAPKRHVKRPNVPSRIILNMKAKEIQTKLSTQGKYVNWQEVMYELCEMYSCQHIGELDLAQADHLEAIHDLIRLQKRIDTFIITYESKATCITLVDLEKAICDDYNFSLQRVGTDPKKIIKISRFDELFIGPLIKNQIVRQIFKYPDEISSIKQLKPQSLNEILNKLCAYLRENDLWSKRVSERDFEVYLLQTCKTDLPYMLSYKITNVGLMIGSLKSVQRLYSQSLSKARDMLSNDFINLFENEKTYLFNQLNDRLKGKAYRFMSYIILKQFRIQLGESR